MAHIHGAGKPIKKRMRRIMNESNKARIDYYHTRGLNVPRGGQPTKDTSDAFSNDKD